MEPRYHEYDPKSAPQIDASKVDSSAALFASQDSDKFFNPILVEEEKKDFGPPPDATRKALVRRWYLIAGVIALVIIVVAAVVGGVMGSRRQTSSSLTSDNAFESSAATTTTSTPTSTPQSTAAFGVPSNGNVNTINDAWAFNGTSLAALTFSTTSDTSGTNYIVFYQHSNGELRKAVHNNSQWHPSEFVTDDALPGTPLSSYWKGDNFQFHLFYYDRNRVLQEIRGEHGSSSWLNGTLGQLSVTSSEASSLTMIYNGPCQGIGNGWLIYHTGSNDEARAVYWNEDTDAWTQKEIFANVKPGAGFSGHSDVGVWRYYYVHAQTSQLSELVCPDCCSNASSEGWRFGLNGPNLDTVPGSISVYNVGLPRMIHYLDLNGSIRELNNSGQYPNETWIENVSSSTEGGNTGVAAEISSVGPQGSIIFDASTSQIPNVGEGLHRGVSMVAGFRGKIQELWVFYQTDGTDVTFQTRAADSAGIWSQPSQIPVGR